MSILVLQSFCPESENAGCFNLNVFFQSYDCLCSVTLPRGPEVWFVVCYFGIVTWISLLYLSILRSSNTLLRRNINGYIYMSRQITDTILLFTKNLNLLSQMHLIVISLTNRSVQISCPITRLLRRLKYK